MRVWKAQARLPGRHSHLHMCAACGATRQGRGASGEPSAPPSQSEGRTGRSAPSGLVHRKASQSGVAAMGAQQWSSVLQRRAVIVVLDPETWSLAASLFSFMRRAPRQGVPRRVPSLTTLVDTFVADMGGDRAVHRCTPSLSATRGHLLSSARDRPVGGTRRWLCHHSVLHNGACRLLQQHRGTTRLHPGCMSVAGLRRRRLAAWMLSTSSAETLACWPAASWWRTTASAR